MVPGHGMHTGSSPNEGRNNFLMDFRPVYGTDFHSISQGKWRTTTGSGLRLRKLVYCLRDPICWLHVSPSLVGWCAWRIQKVIWSRILGMEASPRMCCQATWPLKVTIFLLLQRMYYFLNLDNKSLILRIEIVDS